MGDGPVAKEARGFLRGLSHGDRDLCDLEWEASDLVEEAEIVSLRIRRHEALRTAATVGEGSLIGTRCVTINEIIRLGREARNCLANAKEYWKRFADGQTDIWSVREGDRLVAVLEVGSETGRVEEAFGPSNVTVGPRDAHPVARFCGKAGFGIGPECEGLRDEFAAVPVLGPRSVRVGKRLAVYTEWPTGVRIDMTPNPKRFSLEEHPDTLVLTFDPARSCAEEELQDGEARRAVTRFGRRALRRVAGSIARDQVVPTLVQHRLMALAA